MKNPFAARQILFCQPEVEDQLTTKSTKDTKKSEKPNDFLFKPEFLPLIFLRALRVLRGEN
jgi:hypothetical protein